MYMHVIPAVSYLPTGLAGCSVGLKISHGTRKMARTPRVIKKKKKNLPFLKFSLLDEFTGSNFSFRSEFDKKY
jgi:hypothetical protein